MIRAVLRRYARCLAVSCLILAISSPASAQYFGRQKARFRTFDFQVLKTEHFDIYFYPSERDGVDVAARLAERWYDRFERMFSHQLSSRQKLILYGSHTDFEQTNVIAEELSEGIGGVTEPMQRRIVLPLAGPLDETDHVIGHELVHAFQFDIGDGLDQNGTGSAVGSLPLWFIEGMAEYLSLGNVDANTAMKLRDALRRDKLPSIHDLSGASYFPYQWGHALFAYIAGHYSDAAVTRLLRAATIGGDAEAAIQDVLGINAEELSRDWHAAIRAAYAPVLEASTPAIIGNRLVIQARGFAADLNVGPALSPDGRWLSFLSSRGVFSTDLFLADATTGQVVRKLTNTAGSEHFSSIGFIRSAGAWDPTSTHIAMATIVGARPALTIFNARTGKRDRDVMLGSVDEVLNPTWSANGRAIAFTGMRQGLTDLYVYDLPTATLSQITNDPYTDLQPAWAPDSRHIVFASDRFSTDLGVLQIKPLQLALVDTVGGAITPIHALNAGKHINPQWSPDGTTLYFIGDPDGVPNVYRLFVDTGRIEQLTALDTGVSGIVASSPALSVSSGTGRVAMSVFDDDKYRHLRPGGVGIRGAAQDIASQCRSAATVFPEYRGSDGVPGRCPAGPPGRSNLSDDSVQSQVVAGRRFTADGRRGCESVRRRSQRRRCAAVRGYPWGPSPGDRLSSHVRWNGRIQCQGHRVSDRVIEQVPAVELGRVRRAAPHHHRPHRQQRHSCPRMGTAGQPPDCLPRDRTQRVWDAVVWLQSRAPVGVQGGAFADFVR